MRQIVLDTETTGLDPLQGHRVIEIGAVELLDRRPTRRHFHTYLNPRREIEAGALEVHGLTEEFLADKPDFEHIAEEFLAFVGEAELIIHNAPFDLGFLDAECARLGMGKAAFSTRGPVIDTLELARELHPGQRNNLDALCKRYAIDNSSRVLHGALLDAEILAEVFLAMTGGQADLGLRMDSPARNEASPGLVMQGERPVLRVLRASAAEREAHMQRLEAIRKKAGVCVWLELPQEN